MGFSKDVVIDGLVRVSSDILVRVSSGFSKDVVR